MKISDNIKKLFAVILSIIGAALIVYFAGRPILRLCIYIFSLLSPIIFGYIFARLINPLADRLQKRIKLPRVFSVVFVIIIALGIIVGIVGGLGYKIYDEIKNFCYNWPDILNSLRANWDNLSSQWNRMYVDLPDSVQLMFDRFADNISQQAMTFISEVQVVDNAQDFAKALPGGIIWAIIFILSLFFMVTHKESVAALTNQILGKKGLLKTREIRNQCRVYLGGYVKAQMLLMIIIFVIIAVVLSVFGAPYALFVAAITAFLDALPVFGSGITLWPLSVIYFISGNIKLGIVYILTYLAIMFVRRLLEPKFVSDRMGINPILTLISMYIAYRWIGISGLIIGPIALMIIVSLYKVGLFEKPIKVLRQLFGFIIREIKLFINYLDNITK